MTAEEFVKMKDPGDGWESTFQRKFVEEIAREFAILHVQKALKVASEKAFTSPRLDCGGTFESDINKDSILYAYPLENIK